MSSAHWPPTLRPIEAGQAVALRRQGTAPALGATPTREAANKWPGYSGGRGGRAVAGCSTTTGEDFGGQRERGAVTPLAGGANRAALLNAVTRAEKKQDPNDQVATLLAGIATSIKWLDGTHEKLAQP